MEEINLVKLNYKRVNFVSKKLYTQQNHRNSGGISSGNNLTF